MKIGRIDQGSGMGFGTGLVGELLDLVLPRSCGGCGDPGVQWCARCDAAFGPPVRVHPRLDPDVPCWSLGGYGGPRRAAVLALKEQGRGDLVRPLGIAMAAALTRLVADGGLAAVPALTPAPTRRSAARMRGGDPVARWAAVAAARVPGCAVVELLATRRGVRDSVGLSAAQRSANVAGRIRCRAGQPATRRLVLVDDVLTTGATAAESVRVLRAAGHAVSGIVTLTAA